MNKSICKFKTLLASAKEFIVKDKSYDSIRYRTIGFPTREIRKRLSMN
jgi:hypothetical protein